MTSGLKVWDAAGQVTLDVTDSLARWVNTYPIPAMSAGASTVISVPGYRTNGYWFFAIQGLPSSSFYINVVEATDQLTLYNHYTSYGGGNIIVFRK